MYVKKPQVRLSGLTCGYYDVMTNYVTIMEKVMGVINLNSEQEVPETVEEHIDQQQEETTTHQINEEKANTEIKLDGPLSNVFTKALNAVYSNESIDPMVIAPIEQEEAEEEHETHEEEGQDVFGNALYVYCCNGDNLSQEGLVDAADKLTRAVTHGKYKNVILSMECFNDINNKTALLDKLGRSLGIKVCLSKRSTMEAIDRSVRG